VKTAAIAGRIAQIRERFERERLLGDPDMAWLLAEVDRLRDDRAKLARMRGVPTLPTSDADEALIDGYLAED